MECTDLRITKNKLFLRRIVKICDCSFYFKKYFLEIFIFSKKFQYKICSPFRPDFKTYLLFILRLKSTKLHNLEKITFVTNY